MFPACPGQCGLLSATPGTEATQICQDRNITLVIALFRPRVSSGQFDKTGFYERICSLENRVQLPTEPPEEHCQGEQHDPLHHVPGRGHHPITRDGQASLHVPEWQHLLQVCFCYSHL